MIYLDNCATTKPREEVIDFLINSYREDFGNPSSLHNYGMKMEEKLEDARKIIARSLNVSSEEIYFTSGGTESDNIFIKGVLENTKNKKIITSKLEHSAVLEVFRYLENKGFEVVYLDCDEYGNVKLEDLKKAMDKEVALVSLIHVNNELGNINNIKKAGEIIKSINKDTLFHSDGVQAFGKIPVDLKKLGVDGYSISGHKIHGPKGVGALYIKKGTKIHSPIKGGNQEKTIRSGTENTNSIFAFSKATEIMMKNFQEEYEKKEKLRNYIVDYVKKNIDDVVINTDLKNSPSAILNLSFLYTKGEVILHFLEKDDIFISTASACSSNSPNKSNLEKLDKDKKISEGSIRICLSYENEKEDIDKFLEKLDFAVKDIRKITMRRK